MKRHVPSFVRGDALECFPIGDRLQAWHRGVGPCVVHSKMETERIEARKRFLAAQGAELIRQEGGEA